MLVATLVVPLGRNRYILVELGLHLRAALLERLDLNAEKRYDRSTIRTDLLDLVHHVLVLVGLVFGKLLMLFV